MTEKSGVVGVNILCYFILLLISVGNAQQVNITSQPMNAVCLTENATATFNFAINVGSTGITVTTTGWQIMVGNNFVPVEGRPYHTGSIIRNSNIIFDRLTVTNLSVNDNGTLYRCEPVSDVISDIVSVTVIAGPSLINNITVDEICTNDTTVSWTSTSNDQGLSYDLAITDEEVTDSVTVTTTRFFETRSTSYNFTSLTPNTNYNVTVSSSYMNCAGNPIETIFTTSTMLAARPRSVSNLRALGRTTNTITIVWDPAISPNCGPVLYYTVTIVNSVNPSDMNTTNHQETRARLIDLIRNTTYIIRVAAVNRESAGTTSDIRVVTRDSGGGGLSGGTMAGIIVAAIIGIILI